MGLVAVIQIVTSSFAADAWLDDSSEWLYETWTLVAVSLLIGVPLLALGFVGRLAFGRVRHLALMGSLAWALTIGLVSGNGVGVAVVGVIAAFLVALMPMSADAFAASILCGRKVP